MIRVLRDDDSPRSRASVMRVVRAPSPRGRSLTVRESVSTLSALAHAGRVVVFAGRKEAGKTTLVTRLASLGTVAIAGNDRLP